MRLDGNKRDMERHRGIFQAGQSCERGDGGTTCFDRRCFANSILGFQTKISLRFSTSVWGQRW